MTSALDMALDDLIKNNKQAAAGKGGSARGGRRPYRGSVGSAGPVRKNAARSRPFPYFFSQPVQRAPEGQWQHDLFEEGAGAAPLPPNTGIETGTKVFISNLDFGVSDEDIKELFSEIGDIKRTTVHYDRSGRSKGTAEVVYSRRADAEAAKKQYNNVQLDGKPMKIEIVGTNLSAPIRATNGGESLGRGRGTREMQSRIRGGSSQRGRGGGGEGGRGSFKSAADLDAELESYHAEAMQVA